MRSLFGLALTAIALFATASAALAQQYPNRPLRLIVPYPAGGATDVVARLVAERISEDLGQQVFVDNRPGAGTMIGATSVARSAADDVPTIAEAGVPGFEAWAWNGIAVPTGTPSDIVAKLNAACQKALGNPALRQRFSEISVDPAPSTPEEFGAFIKSETDKWRVVITEAGISLK